jgi:ATP-dependent RNA helicase DeaD
MTEFKELGLSEPVLQAIAKQGFTKPTEIQEKSIPNILDGYDVIAGSKTGSGKTLAFAAPAVMFDEPGQGIQTLILTPTRELADQIKDQLLWLAEYKKLKITTIYGGVAYEPQYAALKTADIVVATPGRLLDHASQETIDLSKTNFIVLDEADRMLEMGFIEDVEKILEACPKEKQTVLFSATIAGVIENLKEKHMRDPVKVAAEDHVDPSKLKQVYYDTPNHLKISLLVHLIKEDNTGLVMVFCNARTAVDYVTENLKLNGIDALAIHGGFSQNKRTNTLNQFSDNKVHAMVCTDVAARGLDIPGVSHVYNYDLPNDSKQYVHRIGRTARAEKDGKAISLVSMRDYDNFDRVLRDNNMKVEKLEKPYVKEVKTVPMRSNRGGNFSDRRGGPNRSRSTGGKPFTHRRN